MLCFTGVGETWICGERIITKSSWILNPGNTLALLSWVPPLSLWLSQHCHTIPPCLLVITLSQSLVNRYPKLTMSRLSQSMMIRLPQSLVNSPHRRELWSLMNLLKLSWRWLNLVLICVTPLLTWGQVNPVQTLVITPLTQLRSQISSFLVLVTQLIPLTQVLLA